jgi:hypothetical protein
VAAGAGAEAVADLEVAGAGLRLACPRPRRPGARGGARGGGVASAGVPGGRAWAGIPDGPAGCSPGGPAWPGVVFRAGRAGYSPAVLPALGCGVLVAGLTRRAWYSRCSCWGILGRSCRPGCGVPAGPGVPGRAPACGPATGRVGARPSLTWAFAGCRVLVSCPRMFPGCLRDCSESFASSSSGSLRVLRQRSPVISLWFAPGISSFVTGSAVAIASY